MSAQIEILTDQVLKETDLTVADPAAGLGWGVGGEKHDIHEGAFGSHLFYDIFLQSGGHGPLAPSLDPLLLE